MQQGDGHPEPHHDGEYLYHHDVLMLYEYQQYNEQHNTAIPLVLLKLLLQPTTTTTIPAITTNTVALSRML